MKRVIIAVLLSCFAVGVAAAYATSDADAQRRRRNRQAQQQQRRAPISQAIAPALGDIRWGMTSKQVFNLFVRQVRERYNPRIAKARDAMREDALRHDLNEEIQRIRRSYVRFDGSTTGWDVSFLRDEFTHGNNESMLVVRDGNSQNFYFFINNRLWKWYKAFDAEVFAGQTFDQFARALQGRFGEAIERTGRMTDRGQEKHWLEWQDRNTRLRAIDENRFYGFYCLVFEQKETLENLANLRTNTQGRRENTHALVDAVTSDESGASTQNQDIVDRITGRIRRRTQAEEGQGNNQSSTSSSSSSSSSMSSMSSSSMQAAPDDDPLADLDF